MNGGVNDDLAPDLAFGAVDSLVGLEEVLANHFHVGAAEESVGGRVEDVTPRVEHLTELGPHSIQAGAARSHFPGEPVEHHEAPRIIVAR